VIVLKEQEKAGTIVSPDDYLYSNAVNYAGLPEKLIEVILLSAVQSEDCQHKRHKSCQPTINAGRLAPTTGELVLDIDFTKTINEAATFKGIIWIRLQGRRQKNNLRCRNLALICLEAVY
jgi:hypothetical protein